MNSRFPNSFSIDRHHMERKVLMRQEDEEEIVNFIGRPFGYYTGKSATHIIQQICASFLPKNKPLNFSFIFCLLLYSGLNELVRCCYHLTLIKAKLRMNVS